MQEKFEKTLGYSLLFQRTGERDRSGNPLFFEQKGRIQEDFPQKRGNKMFPEGGASGEKGRGMGGKRGEQSTGDSIMHKTEKSYCEECELNFAVAMN